MKQHKNDLNPGPLTESGYSGRSCYQANLPDNDRTPFELPVEGHQRLKSISRKGSPGIERVKADGASRKGLKLRTKMETGDQGIIHLYPQVKSPGSQNCLEAIEFRRQINSFETDSVRPEMEVLYANSPDEIPIKIPGFQSCLDVTEFRRQSAALKTDPTKPDMEVLNANLTYKIPVKLPGFLRCIDVTEFRMRTTFLKTIPAKKELEALNTNSSNKIPNGKIVDIFPDIALNPPGRNVFSSDRQLSQSTWKVKSRLKTCFRCRKTMSLSQQVASLMDQENSCEVANRIFEISKLGVCRS